jgi:hypothetical protein
MFAFILLTRAQDKYGHVFRTRLLGTHSCMPSSARLSGCLFLLISLHLSPSLAGGVRLYRCLSSLVAVHSQSGTWCPALWLSVFTCIPSHSCLPTWLLVSGSLDDSLCLFPVIWLPFWLVMSGSLDLSLHLSCLPSFVSRAVQWCPALRMSFVVCFHSPLSSRASGHVSRNFPVSQLICLQSSVCLCGDVWLFRLFAFVCLPSFVSHLLSRTSSVSGVICLQSYVCLSGGVLF